MAATIDSAALQKTQRGRGQGVRDGEAVEKHWVYLEPQASTSGSCGLEALALRCLTAANIDSADQVSTPCETHLCTLCGLEVVLIGQEQMV
jgi:hypothetical protein